MPGTWQGIPFNPNTVLMRQGCQPLFTDEKLRLRLDTVTQLVISRFGIQRQVCLTPKCTLFPALELPRQGPAGAWG